MKSALFNHTNHSTQLASLLGLSRNIMHRKGRVKRLTGPVAVLIGQHVILLGSRFKEMLLVGLHLIIRTNVTSSNDVSSLLWRDSKGDIDVLLIGCDWRGLGVVLRFFHDIV